MKRIAKMVFYLSSTAALLLVVFFADAAEKLTKKAHPAKSKTILGKLVAVDYASADVPGNDDVGGDGGDEGDCDEGDEGDEGDC